MEVYFQKTQCYEPQSTLSACNKHTITDSIANRSLSRAEAQLNAYDIGGSSPQEEIFAGIFARYHYNYRYRKAFQDCPMNNKYRLEKRIGGGAFGNIYAGTCMQTREKVAIKIELQS